MARRVLVIVAVALLAAVGLQAPVSANHGPKIELEKPKKGEDTTAEGGSYVVTVKRDGPHKQASTVELTTDDGSAEAGSDYDDADQTVTFAPGEKRKDITITTNDDTELEGTETFTVNLSSPTNGHLGKRTSIELTILDDQVVEASIADADPQAEGDDLAFPVSLSGPAPGPLSLDWSTSDGTAMAPDDYPAQSGTLLIPAGGTGGTIEVATNTDGMDEDDEDLSVTIGNPSPGLGIDPAADDASGTILDVDDPPVVSIANNPETDEGGALVYSVELSEPSGKTVTVDVETDTAFSSAQPPGDYDPVSTTLTFLPGDTQQDVLVTTHDDGVDDNDSGSDPRDDEFLWLIITGATNASRLYGGNPFPFFNSNFATDDSWSWGTILDDEAEPTVTFPADPSAVEGDDLVYPIALSHPSDRTVSITVRTSDGFSEGTPGSDYVSKTETVDFAPGTTSQSFVVTTIDDGADEPDDSEPGERVWGEITAATNAAGENEFHSNQATTDAWSWGRILDND